nr:PREDICTED: uncharacterized protein LOC107077600 [Lepisosteus oculatus]
MKGSLVLLCGVLLATWGPGLPVPTQDLLDDGQPPGKHQRVASVDDVNVLMYGVLQFSQALHEMYHSTNDKFARISHRLDSKEEKLGLLGREMVDAKTAEEQVKTAVRQLQVEDAELQRQARGIKKLFEKVLEHQESLQKQVSSAEKSVSTMEKSSVQVQISVLKELSERHYKVLRTLAVLVQRQRQQVEEQSRQLMQLQRLIDS